MPREHLLKSESLHSSLEEYQEKVDAGARARAASYETAIESGQDYLRGDRVSYYIRTPQRG